MSSPAAGIWGDPWESHWQLIFTGAYTPPVIPWVPIDVPLEDALNLIYLYNATDGDNWNNNDNWITDTVVENWYGVTVGGGRVSQLRLRNNALNGQLDDWVVPQMLGGELYLYDNVNLTGDVSTWTFPVNMSLFSAYNTGLSGDFAAATWPTTTSAIRLYDTDVSGDLTSFTFWPALTVLVLQDTLITGSVSSWVLNSGLKTLSLVGTAMSGTMPDIPASFKELWLSNSSVVIDFDALTIPSGFSRLGATGCTLTGSIDLSTATYINKLSLDDCGLSQAEVDAIIDDIYLNRAVFTGTLHPTLDIDGTNSAPSGIYQYAATPATGKEKIYALVNDDDAEGFHTWNINYTA